VTVFFASDTRTVGGSAETEQQAVIVIPHGRPSTTVVTTATLPASKLMEWRNDPDRSDI
jgi:hypothetical protein